MSKRILIIIAITIVFLIGIIMYFGVRALQPRAYAPHNTTTATATASPSEKTSEKTATPAPPVTRYPTPETQNLTPETQNLTITAVPTLATNEEIKQYTAATTTPRDINPASFKLNLLDIRAVSYAPGKTFIIEKPSALTPSSIWEFNAKTKTLALIAEKELGLMMQWFMNGRWALRLNVNQARVPALVFIDTATREEIPLSVKTLPAKCAIAGKSPIIYCGVPLEIPPGIILPDDYLKRKFYSDDRIVKIDIQGTRMKELPIAGNNPLDIYNPAVIHNALFFINRYDEKIYTLPLF